MLSLVSGNDLGLRLMACLPSQAPIARVDH